MTVTPSPRIDRLDFLRGLAVMGILLANLPSFGLPGAYFSPMPWGGHEGADLFAWFATFVLIESKMRGLFSMLFGASMLLVIDRAVARGEPALRTHLTRMAVLFVIGLMHLYLIWYGDILAHYAIVGAIAYLFTGLSSRLLLLLGGAMVVIDACMTAPLAASLYGVTAHDPALAAEIAKVFGAAPRADLLAEVAANRTSFATATAWRIAHAESPLMTLMQVGVQTLGAMLFGMAAYRSGFLTGRWSRRAYTIVAVATLPVTWVLHALIARHSIAVGFDYRWNFTASIVLVPILRPLTMAGYIALALLAFREGGWWSGRVAAVGRAAFTNYLGTSVLMLGVFTGLHLFGQLARAQLYWLALLAWSIMLLWSKPWLDRFAYGPMEWVWRSAARGRPQPFRNASPR